MSAARQSLTADQEPFLIARSFACGYSGGTVIEPHQHAWHQLLFASTGAMSVAAGRQSWMIPPRKAVFLPAGEAHTIRMWGTVQMRSLIFPLARTLPPACASPMTCTLPAVCALRAPSARAGFETSVCQVLSVSPLLRELILRVVEMGALDGREPRHHHVMNLLLDEMSAATVEPLTLPLPGNERAVAVARHVLAGPGEDESLDQLGRRYGASRRSLERWFRDGTGMSFGLWRQKARMLDSVRLLSEGKPVTEVALEVGYTSVSAFIAAFKETFGVTPGKLS